MDNQIPKPLVILISLFQGVILTLLYRSIDQNIWPATNPVWLVSLITFVISLPILILFCIQGSNIKKTLFYTLPYSIVLALLGAYVGLQQEPKEFINNNTLILIFFFTALLASFKALMYIQHYLSGQRISFNSLFKQSWRNFIIFVECWLFVGILWAILNLGAGLFAVLDINVFKELLDKDWFVIPVLTLAFGFAVIVFRNIISTADTIATILQTLIKFLLPALTVVSLSFLITLPFTGLASLWQTGSGSLLVIWLQALTLFFTNAVYHEGTDKKPYGIYLHRLVFFGVALLPIYSFISAYGIWLRVDQYGLTVSRCWAILVWALLASFSIGYLVGIIKKKDAWLASLNTVNVVMGKAVLVLMLLVNSPLLNFQQLAADSQLSRLEDGKVSYDNFDYAYFDYSLGRQGYFKLQDLKETLQTVSPENVVLIERMYAKQNTDESQDSFVDFEPLLTFWPSKSFFPEDFLNALYKEETKYQWNRYRENNYYVIAKDLNDDGQPEFIVITENNNHTSANMWIKTVDSWRAKRMITHNPNGNRFIKNYINEYEIQTVSPKWNDLKVGELEFKARLD